MSREGGRMKFIFPGAVTFDNGCVEGGETVGNVVGPPLSRLTRT